ncbi:MAG: adenosylcobinamide-phosphate synthase CbiB [Propionibacteriaceae bacterium]
MANKIKPGHAGTLATRGAAVALGIIIDTYVGDPQRWHPVAGFGNWALWLEKRCWADSVTRGTLFWTTAVAPVAIGGWVLEQLSRRHRLTYLAATALSTWACVGATSLAREGMIMSDLLEAGDLSQSRARLSHLCGRLADDLSSSELTRAAVESIAENANDAVVAPIFWVAIAGIPGIVTHRAINTLDAMIGHHNSRYENFGATSARLDDAAAWISARITGTLGCLCARTVSGDPIQAWKIMLRDANQHPSPNGGWCESAWAGALNVTLGGRNVYSGGRVEDRGLLGDGPRPEPADARRAAKLLRAVTVGATALAGVTLTTLAMRSRRHDERNRR